jgi:hypothetical protein
MTPADTLKGAPDQFIAILRNASTLEAFVGGRYEFPLRQGSTGSPARMFVNLQLGFLDISGGGGDVVDMHHLGVGAMAVKGIFAQSFLEVGVGKNDVFLRHPNRRYIVDGYLCIDPNAIPGLDVLFTQPDGRVRPFVELTGDFDFGHHSDSVQTYFGLNFNFGH